MVRAWIMNDSNQDQRQPHMGDPPEFVDLETLKKLTGVMYWKIDADHYKEDGILQKIKEERGYTYEDQIEITKEKLPNYEEKIKDFFKEHLHSDEEIRFILDGSGYFDVRDRNDYWIRIELVKGDMIVLPAGIYHRFTLDTKNFIKAMRFFVGVPVWTPINRPADNHPSRVAYIKSLAA